MKPNRRDSWRATPAKPNMATRAPPHFRGLRGGEGLQTRRVIDSSLTKRVYLMMKRCTADGFLPLADPNRKNCAAFDLAIVAEALGLSISPMAVMLLAMSALFEFAGRIWVESAQAHRSGCQPASAGGPARGLTLQCTRRRPPFIRLRTVRIVAARTRLLA